MSTLLVKFTIQTGLTMPKWIRHGTAEFTWPFTPSLGLCGSAGLRVNMVFWSGRLSHFTRLLIYTACFIAFVVQFGFVIGNFIKTTTTNTNVKERGLKDIGFPLVLKICVRPGFNETAIKNAGYKHSFDFFCGRTKINPIDPK